MTKIKKDLDTAPGAVSEMEVPNPPMEKQEALTEEQVQKWLKHDLAVAISCLNAIQSDPDIMESLAMYLHGRLKNQINRDKLAKEKEALKKN